MSLVLDTGTMKYRENPNQPWRPLVIKAGMNWESMADTYDPDNGTYEVGQYVLEEGMMYRCISEITTPEVWTPAHWTSVNVGDELSSFIIISDDQPTDETNKIWIAETTAPFGVQIPTMDDHNALENTLNQLGSDDIANDSSVVSGANVTAALNSIHEVAVPPLGSNHEYQSAIRLWRNNIGACIAYQFLGINRTPVVTKVESEGQVDVTSEFQTAYSFPGELYVYTWNTNSFEGKTVLVHYYFNS